MDLGEMISNVAIDWRFGMVTERADQGVDGEESGFVKFWGKDWDLQMQWCSGDEMEGCVEMQESFRVQMIIR